MPLLGPMVSIQPVLAFPSRSLFHTCRKMTMMTKIHEMVTFKVPLTAVIKDYRLGLLNYFAFMCIFIYILGYELWYKVGYMYKPELGLAMRVTLREPKELHDPVCCGKDLSSTCSEHASGKLERLPFPRYQTTLQTAAWASSFVPGRRSIYSYHPQKLWLAGLLRRAANI